MKILAIETSCDETSAAIIEASSADQPIVVLSNVVASSLNLHKKTGGIVPEIAAREQMIAILPVIRKALYQASLTPNEINSIAVTYGPGLIGSLLVGVETAKVLALAWNKPLIPVNHLLGHVFVNWTSLDKVPSFPALGVIVSGGHTDLVWFSSPSNFKWIGGTRDDAAGECFDKCARIILDASYPGGPAISREASFVQSSPRVLPRPMIHDKSLEMSFSGLKTAVTLAMQSGLYSTDQQKRHLAFDLEQAIVDVLIRKITTAIIELHPTCLLVGGGVVANSVFRNRLSSLSQEMAIPLYFPSLSFCGDNAAMIGAAAFMVPSTPPPLSVVADPGLSF